MKNHLSTNIHDLFYIIVCIGLVFGQTACSAGKTNPATTVSPVQNSLEPSSTGTPFTQLPAKKTATPVPDVTSHQTAENNLKNTETPTPATLFTVGPTQVSPKDGMVMVYVPQGKFKMGLDNNKELGYFDPGHTVYLDSYWIDKTDVTNAMYARCVDAGICEAPHSPKNVDTVFKGDDQPAGFVNWNDANTYCQWTGRRLPTNAEWEKAARGTDGRTYPWGNQKPAGNLLNLADKNSSMEYADQSIDDGYIFTSPVGNYPDGASPYGALDMAGNAFQWVQDWYSDDYFVNSPDKNPQGPSSGEYRILRGGSCYNDANGVRSALNIADEPSGASGNISFRCAMSAEPLNQNPGED
jgi:eukaryotic-like serine/threonine-protein kinase